jgi:hypothetical protein
MAEQTQLRLGNTQRLMATPAFFFEISMGVVSF